MKHQANRVIVKIKQEAKLEAIIQAIRIFIEKSEKQLDPKPIHWELIFEDAFEEEQHQPIEDPQIEPGKTYILELPGHPDLDSIVQLLEQMDAVIYAQEDLASGLY